MVIVAGSFIDHNELPGSNAKILVGEANRIKRILEDGTIGINTGSVDVGGVAVIDGVGSWVGPLIDHKTDLNHVGSNTHAAIDAHIDDTTIHFTEASIDHTNILNIGTNSHADIDSHIANGSIHYPVGSIDHTLILNIGTNSHDDIDAHIADLGSHVVGSVGYATQGFAESTTWTFNHQLGARVVLRTIDSAGSEIEPEDRVDTSLNQTVITFGSAVAGTAIAVGGTAGASFPGRYVQGFTNATSVDVTHNLKNDYVTWAVYDSIGSSIIPDSVVSTGSNSLSLGFTVATTGNVVVIGGTLESDGSGRFKAQFTDSTSISLNHNLEDKHLLWVVYDDIGSVVQPDNVVATDENNTLITLGSQMSGFAVVSLGAGKGVGVTTFDQVTNDPVSPTLSQVWFNTTDGQFKGYNGSAVVILG